MARWHVDHAGTHDTRFSKLLNYYALWNGWKIKLSLTFLINIDERGVNDPACFCREWFPLSGSLVLTLESFLVRCFTVFIIVFKYILILLNVNNGDTKKMYEIYWQLKVSGRHQWLRIGVFIANFEQISLILLVFPFLDDMEQVNIEWVKPLFQT